MLPAQIPNRQALSLSEAQSGWWESVGELWRTEPAFDVGALVGLTVRRDDWVSHHLERYRAVANPDIRPKLSVAWDISEQRSASPEELVRRLGELSS